MTELLAFFAGYLIGSIPFGLLLARAAGYGDIRRIGSGNIGTTNVLRTGNKGLAALTLALDMAKGAVPLLLLRSISPEAGWLAGLGAFVGHLFPIWLGFRGGKGVATMLGIALAALPLAGLAFAVVWLVAALATRYSSLGGILGALAAPATAALASASGPLMLFLAMAMLVLVQHRANIARLAAGTEPKIGAKRG